MAKDRLRSSRGGRPRRAEAPTALFNFRLSPEERRRLEQAAALNRQRLADFARDAIVTATEDCLENTDDVNG